MFKILRMVCSIVAAILVTACIFIFIYVNTLAGIACAAAALLFFVLTMLFKYLQEEREKSSDSPARPNTPDADVPPDDGSDDPSKR